MAISNPSASARVSESKIRKAGFTYHPQGRSQGLELLVQLEANIVMRRHAF